MIANKMSLVFTASIFSALSKVPKAHSYYSKNSAKNYLFNYSSKSTTIVNNKPTNVSRNGNALFLSFQSYFNVDYDLHDLRYRLLT